MKILGIIGSSKKDGLTNQLVARALEGAKTKGSETKILYLADYRIDSCRDCRGKTCWTDRICQYEDDSKQVIDELDACDGLILAASVYFLDINGLTKNFMDKMKIERAIKKPWERYGRQNLL